MWRRLSLMGMALAGFFLCVGQGMAWAKDIRFVSGAVSNERPVWAPSVVMIDREIDLKEPLYFILQNSTDSDHEFAAIGLFEVVPEQKNGMPQPDYYTGPATAGVLRPIHVLVGANSTLKIAVSAKGILGNKNPRAEYIFFCPKHKDRHLGGVIYVD